MQRLVDHLCFYTLGVVTPPLSMVLANYKYFQIMHRYVVVMRYEVMVWVMSYEVWPKYKNGIKEEEKMMIKKISGHCKLQSPSDDYNYGYMFDFTDKLNHSQRNVF